MSATIPHPMQTRKGILKKLFEFIFECECRIAKRWASAAHKRLFLAQWRLAPSPEWFDHSIDLFYQWEKTNNSLWVERGVFGSLALKGGSVLELCCGDGFNTKYFYALRSKRVVACDFDDSALDAARRKNPAQNVEYLHADIRNDLPAGKFENIVWDAAIEHFTPEEIRKIMANIKARLEQGGILSGYTLVEKGGGQSHLHQHEYEFKDKDDLKSFLTPHFKNVMVFETIFPTRHNLYFWASDALIPFSAGWPSSTVATRP